MGYKDVLVVLDAEARARDRIVLAAGIAERFGAHLIGLYVATEPPGRLEYFNRDAPLLGPIDRDAQEQVRVQSEGTRVLFEDIANRHSPSSEWRTASGDPSEVAAVHGRYTDLIILGQLNPDEALSRLLRPHPEAVAPLAGRPILVVPYVGSFADIGRRVMVAWDASREATRAVNDAMPVLARAASVTVITVDPQASENGHGEIAGADIALHLARHGVSATIENAVSDGVDIGNALLSQASDLGADLLVMGAYGHSRVHELLLGGATRTVLASMTLPVLMAH